ncbi:MAG: hypothetical protein N3A58_07400 [Spirochaetes bacterium]|nr:hypothetical protein [Spirochaetota bacterium]
MKYKFKDYCLASLLFPGTLYKFNFKKFIKEFSKENFLYLGFSEYLNLSSPFFYNLYNIKIFKPIFVESFINLGNNYIPFLVSLVAKKEKKEEVYKNILDYRRYFKTKIRKQCKTIDVIYEDLNNLGIKINFKEGKNYSSFDLIKLILTNEENVINSKIDQFLLSYKSTFLIKNVLVWFLNLRINSFTYYFIPYNEILEIFSNNFEIFIHTLNLNIKEINLISQNLVLDGFILSKFEYYDLIKEKDKKSFLNNYLIRNKNRIKIRYGSYYIDEEISLTESPGYLIF